MPGIVRPRLIVKTRSGRDLPVREGFQFGNVSYRVEPLFEQDKAAAGFGVAGEGRWYVVEAAQDLGEEERPWDQVYKAFDKRMGFAAADAPAIVEPDLLQTWSYANPTPLVAPGSAFRAAEVCDFNEQNSRNGKTPVGPDFGWFLRPEFSQLREAREAVGAGQRRARIAHIDTGYDPNHVTFPKGFNAALQKNFIEGEDPGNAQDPATRGLLNNPGHGPGTLSILAGNKLKGVPQAGPLQGLPLGGAPNAEIVPLRVANSVLHFYTSAVARAFEYVALIQADVVSMSMGGLASSAWTEAVNRAYEAGVVIVCAAGNNFGGFPTRFIVYPARYKRVIAACGVMANGEPYNRLPLKIMQGNWGPRKKMKTAMSAYTPNMPWAEIGCEKIVDMDGQGTSSATPQIAAAAALWLMKHNPSYPEGWMKVEAVRKALFESAAPGDSKRLGRGTLRAHDALAIGKANAAELRQTPRDSASFPIWRLLTGLGVTRDARSSMFELEGAQLLQTSKTLEDILEQNDVDPDERPDRIAPKVRQQLVEAMAADPACSLALRRHLEQHFVTEVRPQIPVDLEVEVKEDIRPALEIPVPSVRELRTYAFDPSLGLELDTAVLNKTTVEVPWEELKPGPVGEYVEIVDLDPASRCAYAPVDLSHPYLLAQDGLAPSEGNPQFHQQMIYAVAMRTIKNFEKALGRTALWSPRRTTSQEANGRHKYREDFVRRLRIYPHALRQANAYYSPERKALLFGYFPASWTDPGKNLPGGMVFTCLSHDIVAHETTHALLDGLHRRFAEPSNPDVLAFHEAFADIVALFQHFSFPDALRHQIARTRGDLGKQNMLGELAQQFGEAIGRYGALRDAIGRVNPETKQWEPLEPDPNEYLTTMEPHTRGAILVAAVFDAFLAIYKKRVRDLMRIATGGTGALPEGDLHPDLVNRLADEAAKTAQHVLNICIRALDYCPPVDITFGEYLRALITADWDLVRDDKLEYRVAFVEAFRRRGIYPKHVRTLSVDSLLWRAPAVVGKLGPLDLRLNELVDKLRLSWDPDADRKQAHRDCEANCAAFWKWAAETIKIQEHTNYFKEMGLAWGEGAPERISRNETGDVAVEVHSVRPARRVAPNGSFITELVVEVTQRSKEYLDPAHPERGHFWFRGGCTLLIDLQKQQVRYCIKKDICSEERLEAQRRFRGSPSHASLRATYFEEARESRREPFSLLHSDF